jgi:hypothetical protein
MEILHILFLNMHKPRVLAYYGLFYQLGISLAIYRQSLPREENYNSPLLVRAILEVLFLGILMSSLAILVVVNKHSIPTLVSIATLVAFAAGAMVQTAYPQANPSHNPSNPRNSQISATFTLDISNDTLEDNNYVLWSSVVGVLSSGPNVLKTSATTAPVFKTKIVNKINNGTQTIEGVDTTNAVLSIEIIKALKTVNSSSYSANRTGIVSIDTTSLCKPSDAKSIACQNSVEIK